MDSLQLQHLHGGLERRRLNGPQGQTLDDIPHSRGQLTPVLMAALRRKKVMNDSMIKRLLMNLQLLGSPGTAADKLAA